MGQVPYDQGVAAYYGQIGLAVMTLLITISYKESQNRVMTSDWKKALFWRRILWIAVPCFCILSWLMLLSALSKMSLNSSNNSGVISTLLVAVLTVSFLSANESCRVRDIFDLRNSEIDVARITALTEGKDAADRSIWQALCSCVCGICYFWQIRKFVALAMELFQVLWRWVSYVCTFRQTRNFLALTMELMGLSSFQRLYRLLKPSFDSAEDVIESCKIPPLLLKSTDYQSVSVMVRLDLWKIVCACETSYQEFYATIRLLQNRYKDDDDDDSPTLLYRYSKLLGLLEEGDGTILSKHYLNELEVFRRKKGLEDANEADVIIQWIYNSAKLRNGLRLWNSRFKVEVHDMLAVCPRSSGYWEIVNKLAKVNDSYEFNALYKEEMTSDEDSLKLVFILYALKSFETKWKALYVTEFREVFMANCKNYVKGNMKDLVGLQFSASAQNLAAIAVLTFFRVGRGWNEKWKRSSIVVEVDPKDEEALEPKRNVVDQSVKNDKKNENRNVEELSKPDKSVEHDKVDEDPYVDELSEQTIEPPFNDERKRSIETPFNYESV